MSINRLQRTALPACRQTGAPPLMLSVKQDIGCSHVALIVFGRPGFAGSFIDIHMTEIRKPRDCGNWPRNRTLQDLAIAIAVADSHLIAQLVTDDVLWRPAGGRPVSGADAVSRGLARYGPAKVLTLEHAISHGRSGAVNGVVEYARKRSGPSVSWLYSRALRATRCGRLLPFQSQ
jgi:hypothetical protein